jgi:hypothetical protein
MDRQAHAAVGKQKLIGLLIIQQDEAARRNPDLIAAVFEFTRSLLQIKEVIVGLLSRYHRAGSLDALRGRLKNI